MMAAKTSSPVAKETRARSWRNSQERKKLRVAAQDEAHKRNVKAGASPWDAACQIRFARRAMDPEVQRRARQHRAE